ncbi:hypothetical protein BCAR13_1130005 [Paraburkholderia caribensis]|nr:hypothetical protein BCAR13_1130005 [Paraburkholderia caribensis]
MFQFSNVETDGGWRKVQCARRFGERAMVGNGDQRAQTVQADFSHSGLGSAKLNVKVVKFNFLYSTDRWKIGAPSTCYRI